MNIHSKSTTERTKQGVVTEKQQNILNWISRHLLIQKKAENGEKWNKKMGKVENKWQDEWLKPLYILAVRLQVGSLNFLY